MDGWTFAWTEVEHDEALYENYCVDFMADTNNYEEARRQEPISKYDGITITNNPCGGCGDCYDCCS